MRLCDIWTESISIHAPPRGATRRGANRHRGAGNFNSRPSARGDRKSTSRTQSNLFQFTPLREGRLRVMPGGYTPGNFNSRPSARGDSRFVVLDCYLCISIHAPPRGATHSVARRLGVRVISIHAPPRGATTHAPCASFCHIISIHAPPRGATLFLRHLRRGRNFNSRPSARGDVSWEDL